MICMPFQTGCSVFIFPEVCNGSRNATHMECWAPAIPADVPEEDTGAISLQLDGQTYLLNERFVYHPDAKVIPFDNDDNILHLKPEDTKVSLHVRQFEVKYL